MGVRLDGGGTGAADASRRADGPRGAGSDGREIAPGEPNVQRGRGFGVGEPAAVDVPVDLFRDGQIDPVEDGHTVAGGPGRGQLTHPGHHGVDPRAAGVHFANRSNCAMGAGSQA